MQPIQLRLSAAGFSDWIPLARLLGSGFAVGLGVKMSSNGNLTYSVQHTMDYLYNPTQPPIARVTTTATVTWTNHGLSVNDWVYVWGAGAPLDGQFAVAAITDQNNFTYTVANSGATGSGVAWVETARVFEHATLTAKTASADGNYEFPPSACRLAVTTYVAGYVDLTVIQAA